jgi:hypothetical protein
MAPKAQDPAALKRSGPANGDQLGSKIAKDNKACVPLAQCRTGMTEARESTVAIIAKSALVDVWIRLVIWEGCHRLDIRLFA